MIIVVMGVSGSGKTTIGTMLAHSIQCSFLEGDSLHSKRNIEKMRHGIPLTDSDRAPWLKTLDPVPQFKATAKLGEFLTQLPA